MSDGPIDVQWTWLFVDAPVAVADASLAFWTRVTETTPSPPRGDHDEFVTLLPREGPAWLKHQRVDGPGGVHLDLDVEDPATAAAVAAAAGATVRSRARDADGSVGLVVLHSPGGFPFCLTRAGARRIVDPIPTTSLADQVCLDVPPSRHEREVAFWADLTGWTLGSSIVREEFHLLRTPDDSPVRVLLQRLDDEGDGRVRGHLDVACGDRDAIVADHVAAGARVRGQFPFWTVLEDPAGAIHCCTDRDPQTGMLTGLPAGMPAG